MDAGMCVIGVKAGVKPVGERLLRNPQLKIQGLGPFLEAPHMPLEKRDHALAVRTRMNAKAFPDSVAENESGIENGNFRLGARKKFAVDIDEDVFVSPVRDISMGRMGHKASNGGFALRVEHRQNERRAKRRIGIGGMKVYISVDMEGAAGVAHWDEADKRHPDYPEFREQMSREAVAAVEGARLAGATEIFVKDAHESGRNIIASMLPEDVTIIRAWAGHPLCMLQGLDRTFDAVLMIGYHAAAGSEGNSLAHTLSREAALIKINGAPASEFLIHALASSMLGVPTVFVSGDAALIEEVRMTNANIGHCAVKEGCGASTISMTPASAAKAIRNGVEKALSGDLKKALLLLPNQFSVEITYANPNLACRHQWYPGCVHVGDRTIRFETDDYFDALRMLNYVT